MVNAKRFYLPLYSIALGGNSRIYFVSLFFTACNILITCLINDLINNQTMSCSLMSHCIIFTPKKTVCQMWARVRINEIVKTRSLCAGDYFYQINATHQSSCFKPLSKFQLVSYKGHLFLVLDNHLY